jgi:hypothetical protein
VKVRAAEDKKAKIEVLYELLQRSYQDLTVRLAEEKESKMKAQEALKDAQKEAEKERTDKLRERLEREKSRIMEREDAVRLAKLNLGKDQRFKDQSRVLSAPKDRLSLTTSRKIQDTDNESLTESVCTSASASFPEDSPRSTALAQTDNEKEKARVTGPGLTRPAFGRVPSMGGQPASGKSCAVLRYLVRIAQVYRAVMYFTVLNWCRGELNHDQNLTWLYLTRSSPSPHRKAGGKAVVPTKGSGPSKQAVLNRSQNTKTLNSSGLLSDCESGRNGTVNRRSIPKTSPSNTLSSSLPYGRTSVRKDKEEDWSLEGQYRLKHSTDEMDDNPDVPLLGPPIAPTVRSNIAARSKEALQRHQVWQT